MVELREEQFNAKTETEAPRLRTYNVEAFLVLVAGSGA